MSNPLLGDFLVALFGVFYASLLAYSLLHWFTA
jgi:hypothetical protein